MKRLAGLVYCIMAGASQAAWACKPVHGHVYVGSTEAEKIARAHVVFSGKVVSMRAAPANGERFPNPHAMLYTFDVARWEKGDASASVEVLDDPGTDCDHLFFITHLMIAKDAQLPSPAWRVFAVKANGRLRLLNAEQLK